MNLTPLPGARAARSRLLRFVIDNNPFYLLSALCMLGGLLTLTNSLSYSPIPQRHLLMLIATLNCYELLLVALALWLIVGRNLIRDGAILLGIEALFLADTAMLNAELFTVDFRLGAAINLLLLLLAAGKLAIIFRALNVRSGAAYALILASLFLLFMLPGLFKHLSAADNGRLESLAVYGAWWAVGLLPLLFAFVFRRPDTKGKFPIDHRPKSHPHLVLTFVLFSFGSILIHLRLTNWVYQVGWEWANLSPLLLGLAVCAGAIDYHAQTFARRSRTQLFLPMLALAVSLHFSSDLLFSIGPLPLSPMRLAFLGMTLVYLHGLWLHRHIYFAMASAVCLAAIGAGASVQTASENVEFLWSCLTGAYRRLRSQTASDWGVLSVIASFVLLVLGAGFSMLRGSPRDSGDPPASDTPRVPPVTVR